MRRVSLHVLSSHADSGILACAGRVLCVHAIFRTATMLSDRGTDRQRTERARLYARCTPAVARAQSIAEGRAPHEHGAGHLRGRIPLRRLGDTDLMTKR